MLSGGAMPYIVFLSPQKRSIGFKSTAKIYRRGYDVIVEADGVPHKIGADPTVSRDKHAVITVENGKVYVMDLGSTNGVIVNGIRIEPYKRVEISPSDTITIGYLTTIRIVPEPIKETS
jgi:pSer/pThr/pTyr-binding forkhead associated (FHA) protein